METGASRPGERIHDVSQVLEIAKVLELVALHATTPSGALRVRRLSPLTSRSALDAMRAEIAEASGAIEGNEPLSVAPFPDVSALLPRAATLGSLLEHDELLGIAALLRSGAAVRSALRARDGFPNLRSRTEAIDPISALAARIERTFDAAGAVRDDATPALAKIRRDAERLRSEIRRQLERRMRALAADGVLQDDVVTMRAGRLVLPVIAHAKDRVPGIVHDESSTGATLFIEPMEAVPLNNRVAELLQEDAREVRALLAALTDEVRNALPAIERNAEILTHLDALLAGARYGRAVAGHFPRFSDDGEVRLLEARHPLLLDQSPSDTVPLELVLERGVTTLLLSGPNTGGKTVALKTVGLLSLLAQCGVPIPAGVGTALPVFSRHFADIGDDQSIEENLSSFSSRLRTVREVLREAGPGSLVLLDELGTGTDPEEGGALAGALLRALARRGARVVATTHLGFLMDLVAREDGMENASMAFDSASGRPTYRVVAGVPGKSHALEIARGLGVDEAVLAEANALLSEGARRSRELLRDLEDRLARARALEARLAQNEAAQSARAHAIDERTAALERDEIEAKRRSAESARTILRQAERKVEEVLGTLKKNARPSRAKGAVGATPHEVPRAHVFSAPAPPASAAPSDDAATAARDGIARLREARREVDRESPPSDPFALSGEGPEHLEPGESVMVAPHGRKGTVLSGPDRAGRVEVLVGSVRFTLPVSSLRRARDDEREAAAGSARWSNALALVRPEARVVPLELDLRGLRAEEAVGAVDRYIDSAAVAGLPSVRIIHGKGTGALRREVVAFLQGDERVKAFRGGTFQEGDLGVTIVEIAV
ncbi:MAG: endonuclease MutS2 [bacterium]